ncbi:MAG: tRNA uridine-5-carboxymethylaminomethyl(34) synthesis GTPase MnmE, partial [Akkermansiaceae bacterium]
MSGTIVAIASPPGMGAVSVIRLSGPGAFEIAGAVIKGGSLPEPRR